MNEKHFEALSAFFDGEQVECDLLAESLGEPGAAELLAEFAAMRRHVQQDTTRPAPGFVESMHARLERRWRGRGLRHWFVPLALAASLVLVAGVVGFRIGTGGGARGVPSSVPQATNARAAGLVDTPRAAVTDRSALPRPPQTRAASRATRREEPPDPSLRLRMARWQDVPSGQDTERR